MLVAGIMSGTSVDGIDVAFVEINGDGYELQIELRAFHELPYEPEVREAILSVSNSKTHTADISQLNFLLGRLYGEAVLESCELAGVPVEALDLVGSHGQTIYHQPNSSELSGYMICSTLQIGEPALIANITGLPVVADFRTADMASGGQGAPLVPYVDYLLYRDSEQGRVILNIGGIANLTAIPPGAPAEEVIAFDTGPGNMPIDGLIEVLSNGAEFFDRDGRLAARGNVDGRLLAQLMETPYLDEPPPKSAGREQFGREFVENLVLRDLKPQDLLATVTAFTTESIVWGIKKWVSPRLPVDQLVVSGGGVHNPEIMSHLKNLLSETEFIPANTLGPSADAKEATAFAVLAYETFHQRPSNVPSATGADAGCILGKMSWPSRKMSS